VIVLFNPLLGLAYVFVFVAKDRAIAAMEQIIVDG